MEMVGRGRVTEDAYRGKWSVIVNEYSSIKPIMFIAYSLYDTPL